MDGEDVVGGRRLDLHTRLVRQLDRPFVPCRVRRDAGVVEDHPEREDGLPHGRPFPRLGELRDEFGHVGRR